MIDRVNDAEIVRAQQADPEINVLTGLPFDMDDYTDNLTMDDFNSYLQTLPAAERGRMQAMISSLPEEEVLATFAGMMRDAAGKATTYEDNLALFGVVDLDNPSSISIYPKDYDSKESISAYIEDYNRVQKDAGHDEHRITTQGNPLPVLFYRFALLGCGIQKAVRCDQYTQHKSVVNPQPFTAHGIDDRFDIGHIHRNKLLEISSLKLKSTKFASFFKLKDSDLSLGEEGASPV